MKQFAKLLKHVTHWSRKATQPLVLTRTTFWNNSSRDCISKPFQLGSTL